MKITNVRIKLPKYDHPTRLVALASVLIDDAFRVSGIKIIQGTEKLFIAMPSHKDRYGNYHCTFHPINEEARLEIEAEIFDAYYDKYVMPYQYEEEPEFEREF